MGGQFIHPEVSLSLKLIFNMKLPWFSKNKLTKEEERIFWSALTLPEEMAEATDFDAWEAIKLDYSIQLPESYSLGKWIYQTQDQKNLGSCTAMWTTHSVQILNVKKRWVVPTTNNIITPDWKDLWSKMWHSTTQYDGWDYVEKAVSTALKDWILVKEDWSYASFDAYATDEWTHDDIAIEKMKRYLYQWCPIVWLVKWNRKMWNEMIKGEVKTVPNETTWAHCIALVGWDETGLRFINSRQANDAKRLKSRFHITYNVMKQLWWRFNFRYRVLYIKEDELKSSAYLKRKNSHKMVLEVLKKYYPEENSEVKKWIEAYSASVRKFYSELNEEIPK